MELNIYPDLTRDYILDRIPQEQIMERYLGIPVETEKLITSPLRIDNNPTCSFYYNKYGRLRFRDFSGHFWGDCFDVVAYQLGVNTNDKKAFILILHTIAKDFRIHKYTDYNEVNNYNRITGHLQKLKKTNEITKFNIEFRKWNYHDVEYWKQFNVSIKLLNAGLVYPAQEIEVSKLGYDFTTIYTYSTKDPAYCYYGGRFSNNTVKWKIYLPYRKEKGETGFYSNSSFLQGKSLITCGRVGVITNSYKAALSLQSIGIQSVAPGAESVLLTPEEYWFMKSRFDFLVSCMDFDLAGVRMANQLRKQYNIIPIMLTNGRFSTHDFKAKDPADYMKLHGPKHYINVIKNLHNNHAKDFRQLDRYIYNSLKFI